MAAPRSTLRLFHSTSLTSARIAFRQTSSTFRQPLIRQCFQRRTQTTVAGVPTAGIDTTATPQTGFAKLWNSNVGPKTVHFWAPIMKWGVVLAGVADFFRPPESLSLSQNCALMATGAIWTRWCFVIKPRNIFLATVNFFVLLTGATQVSRIILYNRSLDGNTTGQEIKKEVRAGVDEIKDVVAHPKRAVEQAKRT